MGLLKTISDTTKVSDVMELLYDPTTTTEPSKVFGSLPILPPSVSGIYGGRNDQILLAYDEARSQSSGCRSLAGTIALMEECPSWGQEENCVKTASLSLPSITWLDGVSIFEALVGRAYYTSVFRPAYDQNNAANVGVGEQNLMTAVRDNVQIFVPGVPGHSRYGALPYCKKTQILNAQSLLVSRYVGLPRERRVRFRPGYIAHSLRYLQRIALLSTTSYWRSALTA
jgi:hypothetical protein